MQPRAYCNIYNEIDVLIDANYYYYYFCSYLLIIMAVVSHFTNVSESCSHVNAFASLNLYKYIMIQKCNNSVYTNRIVHIQFVIERKVITYINMYE